MKKQFFRVKQLADQTFLRADRSECLNQDELKKADWKVEYISKVFTEVIKKLPAPVPQAEALEKRKKKYYEFNLATTMNELAGDDVEKRELLLKEILKDCGEVEMRLSEDQLAYENRVEQYVSAPINNILEKELPNISKQKKNLNKYILDKDSATSRYHNATKNGIQKENLKEDMDEADVKVDQSRDVLAAEMFGLLRKEHEMCIYLLQLLKMQRSYHESALNTLTNVIPILEQRISESHIKPVFGCYLTDHLKINKRMIAFPIELCVVALMEIGMSEEGLFRVVGGAAKVKRLKLSMDSGCFTLPLIPEYRDVHVLASTLKSYLRELPEPLLSHSLYGEWMNSMKHPEEERLKVIQAIIKRMPHQHRDNLGFLIQFLSNLSKHSENKMTTSNIAIVMSPNLLWAKDEEINMHMKNCATVNMIVEFLIIHVHSLFPEDLLVNVTIKKAELFGPEKSEYSSGRSSTFNYDHQDMYPSETSSPRPALRRKVKAPPPPSVKNEDYFHENNIQDSCPTSYNTLPLTRSHKLRASDIPRPKPKSESNSEEESSGARRSSLVINEKNTHNKTEVPNSYLVNSDNTMSSDDHKHVTTQTTVAIQVTKSKPVQQAAAQIIVADVPVAENELQKSNHAEVGKPIAAPRTSILETEKFTRKDSMSKSLNSIDSDNEGVQVREPSKEDLLEKPGKPAIPVRPASLRTPMPRTLVDVADPAIHKTQCSVYSIPHKQQTSIVTLPKTFAAGHDNQIAEKERFLGHQPTPKIALENKYSDINSNCDNKTKPDIPSKPPLVKSTEKLNVEPIEKMNGNSKTSHIRTRSDGNIVDVQTEGITCASLLQTPPSPRSLNKPSQPPPPPPVINKPKLEPETTNF